MWIYIIIAYFIVLATPIIVSIIYDKRDPVKSLSWILVVIFMPFIGSFLYACFGQNFRKRKIFKQKHISDYQYADEILSRQFYQINSPILSSGSESLLSRDLATLLLKNNNAPLFRNHSIEILSDGEHCFNVIKDALLAAKSFIHIESYIIKNDKIGKEIADILHLKASQGVEVRVIYDSVGSWDLSKQFVKNLRKNGVQIEPFMPVYFPLFTTGINYRNHRKIIVIDGKIGFTGGVNIADKYIVGLKHIGDWRDIHLKIDGESVLSLQRIFMADWSFVSDENLEVSDKYFPHHDEPSSGNLVQIANSGPDSDWATIMQAFFAAITKATESIHIATPYFTPNQSILTAIKVAALSGIDVKLIVPGKSDSKLVLWATRSFITELLQCGVKVYFYRKGFIHSKLMIIDGEFCGVGSANMDVRSFEDNFEVTAFIYDKNKSKELDEIFAEDINNSRQVHRRWWLARPLYQRFYESIARLLTPLL